MKMRRAGPALVTSVFIALAMAACGGAGGGGDTAHSTSAAPRPRQQTPPAGPPPRLTVSHPCDNAKGFTCSTLLVGLDHSGRTPGDPAGMRFLQPVAISADGKTSIFLYNRTLAGLFVADGIR